MIASWPMLGSLHVNTANGSHDTGLLDIACLSSTAASEVSRVSQEVSLAAGPALCRSKLKTLLPQKLTPSGTNALHFVGTK